MLKRLLVPVLVLLFFGVVVSALAKNSPQSSYNLYWSDSCPHCHIVLDHLKANPVPNVKLKQIDNTLVQKDFTSTFEACFPTEDQASVPLLTDSKGLCLLGDEDIIEFLTQIPPLDED